MYASALSLVDDFPSLSSYEIENSRLTDGTSFKHVTLNKRRSFLASGKDVLVFNGSIWTAPGTVRFLTSS